MGWDGCGGCSPSPPSWRRPVCSSSRLRFNRQRFRPVDIGQPYTRQEDPFVGTPDVRARSATAAVLWAATGSWLRGQPVPRRLLWFRLVNAGLFALTIGGITALAIA